jgi:hypothetical protein
MKLYESLKSLILEVVSRDQILNAMDGRNVCSLNYDDNEDPGGKGTRWVEIYCYGKSKSGNDVIRVYQIGGDTKTIQPGWKLFRVDRMLNFNKLSGRFNQPRPKFNPNNDKSMESVYKITNFEKQFTKRQ